MTPPSNHFASAERVVIKIGSALLMDDDGTVHAAWLQSLAEDIAKFTNEHNKEFIIVSSGAVAIGRSLLNMSRDTLRLEEKQAAAAYGQPALIETYRGCFRDQNLRVAQILLNLEDSENRRRFLNVRSTLTTLLFLGVIPIINENDTVGTKSMRFGDNDRLAARVAQMLDADCLILLSDIEGLYTQNPSLHSDAEHVPVVNAIDDNIQNMAGDAISDAGTGGMRTKLAAAEIATSFGCDTVIMKGEAEHPLTRLFEGEKHTVFTASQDKMSARKSWIAETLQPMGKLILDAGAVKALHAGNSLLPIGVRAIEGDFSRGDPVSICDPEGQEIARGLVSYSSESAASIIGRESGEIHQILGFSGRDELVHRDYLVMK